MERHMGVNTGPVGIKIALRSKRKVYRAPFCANLVNTQTHRPSAFDRLYY